MVNLTTELPMFIQNTKQKNIKTVRQGDASFMLNDGITVCPRAGFEINTACPKEYKMIIIQCIDNGWLKPVAHVYGKELTWQTLLG